MQAALNQIENSLVLLGEFLQFDIFVLDLIGTAIFAYSGAVVAFQHRFTILGAMVIALATATGGGTLRSLLVDAPSVFWINRSEYLIVIALSVALAMLPKPFRIGIRTLPFHIADAFSMAVFISLGISMYNDYVHTIPAAVAMAVLTGMGGGLIRDMLVRRSPQALIDPAYPFVVLGGASGGLHALLTGYPVWLGAVIGVFSVELIRGTLQISGVARHAIGLAGTAASDTVAPQRASDEHTSYGFPYPLMTLMCVAAMSALAFSRQVDLPAATLVSEALATPESVIRSKKPYEGMILETPPDVVEVAAIDPESAWISDNRTDPVTVADSEPELARTSDGMPEPLKVGNLEPEPISVSDSKPELVKPGDLESELANVSDTSLEPVQAVISDSDIGLAKVEFNKLVTAIELRNTLAVDALTTGDENRQKLFSDLFSRYIKFDLNVTDFYVKNDTVRAMLTLNSMLLPDGNLTMPSETYRSIPVAIMKQGESWGLIEW